MFVFIFHIYHTPTQFRLQSLEQQLHQKDRHIHEMSEAAEEVESKHAEQVKEMNEMNQSLAEEIAEMRRQLRIKTQSLAEEEERVQQMEREMESVNGQRQAAEERVLEMVSGFE